MQKTHFKNIDEFLEAFFKIVKDHYRGSKEAHTLSQYFSGTEYIVKQKRASGYSSVPHKGSQRYTGNHSRKGYRRYTQHRQPSFRQRYTQRLYHATGVTSVAFEDDNVECVSNEQYDSAAHDESPSGIAHGQDDFLENRHYHEDAQEQHIPQPETRDEVSSRLKEAAIAAHSYCEDSDTHLDNADYGMEDMFNALSTIGSNKPKSLASSHPNAAQGQREFNHISSNHQQPTTPLLKL